MITSANQYLRPEYLPPVSSPLDANKSPLALLAKTCSSIGVDTPSLKSLTSSGGGGSSSASNSSNSSSNSDRRTTPKSKPNNSSTSECGHSESNSKLNFKPYELSSSRANKYNNDSEKSGTSPAGKVTPTSKAQLASPNSSAPLSYTSLGLPDMHKDSLAAFYKAYGFLSPNCCPNPAAGSPYANMMPPPITLDKTGAYPSIYPPTPSATAAAAIAAYNYARVKGGNPLATGAATNPLCRDPYCGGACGQYGPLHSHAALMAAASSSLAGGNSLQTLASQPSTCTPATCPNGCNQCEHQRYMAAIAAAYGNSFPGLPPGYPASYVSTLAALQQRAAVAAAAAAAAGNVCNWIVGDSHCGKRFSTSEELLVHLKSHTNSLQQQPNLAEQSSSSSSSSSASTSTTTTTTSTPSPSRQTPATNSPGPHNLSVHNSRYHPYSKPVSSSPGIATSGTPTYNLAPVTTAASGPYPTGALGLPPPPPAFVSPNLYYPYMTPGLFSGRIGPPVPP